MLRIFIIALALASSAIPARANVLAGGRTDFHDPVDLLISFAILATAGVLLWVASSGLRHKSDREELRDLYEYFRKKDAAERRGEIWPPR